MLLRNMVMKNSICNVKPIPKYSIWIISLAIYVFNWLGISIVYGFRLSSSISTMKIVHSLCFRNETNEKSYNTIMLWISRIVIRYMFIFLKTSLSFVLLLLFCYFFLIFFFIFVICFTAFFIWTWPSFGPMELCLCAFWIGSPFGF